MNAKVAALWRRFMREGMGYCTPPGKAACVKWIKADRFRAVRWRGRLMFGVGCYLAPWRLRMSWRPGFLAVWGLGYVWVFVAD